MLYRGSTLGTTLTSALDELVAEEEIPSDLALKIKEQFDDSFNQAFSKIRIKGSFKNCPMPEYRCMQSKEPKLLPSLICENCWTFILSSPTIRLETETISCTKLKVVAIDDTKLNPIDEPEKPEKEKPTKRRKAAPKGKGEDSD